VRKKEKWKSELERNETLSLTPTRWVFLLRSWFCNHRLFVLADLCCFCFFINELRSFCLISDPANELGFWFCAVLILCWVMNWWVLGF
jgi:hypothetical protein